MNYSSFILRLLSQTVSIRKLTLSLVVTALSVLGLIVLESKLNESAQPILLSSQAAYAQNVRSRDVWQQVYQQLPDLPRENQYVNKETGQVDSDNTLVNRLIRYHVYVKGRPVDYRLDWKLTLADYLGANELMQEEVYPGNEVLRENPIQRDRAAIKSLNRQQRDNLVQTLVNIFNSNYSAPASEAPPQPSLPQTRPPSP